MPEFAPFASTVWTLIHRARANATDSLNRLVTLYRKPVERYLRQRGADDGQAEDLAQEVFVRIFQKDLLKQVDRAKGRFRSFLLGVANNILREHSERARAQKRGAGARHVSLEAAGIDVARRDEEEFTHDWMLHLVRLAMEELARSSRAAVRRDLEVFRSHLRSRPSHQALAAEFGIAPDAVKHAIHETKRRIRREVAALVNAYTCSPDDFTAEMAAFDRHALGAPRGD